MKVSEKIVERARESIGSGESIDEMMFVMQGPKLAMYFGALGAAFMQRFWVVATDENIYVMEPRGKEPMEVRATQSRSGTDVTAKKGFPVGSLGIDTETYWLPMGQQNKALAIADGNTG